MTASLPRVLVVFHIFYRDQIPWFLGRLSHISRCQWDLVVTGPDLQEEDRQQILAFKPDARFIATDNVGYDVWPFIQVIQQIDLAQYDILLKLHTKGLSKGYNFHYKQYHFKSKNWRNGLVDALLKSERRWREVLDMFDKDPQAGMVCSRKYIVQSGMMPEDKTMLDNELQQLGIQCDDHRFCAGTMFAVRPQLLLPLLERELRKEDFISANKSHSSGTLSHVYERILGILVTAQGYKICPIGYWLSVQWTQCYYRFIAPALAWLFEINRDWSQGPDGQKYLRVLGIRFNLK